MSKKNGLSAKKVRRACNEKDIGLLSAGTRAIVESATFQGLGQIDLMPHF